MLLPILMHFIEYSISAASPAYSREIKAQM